MPKTGSLPNGSILHDPWFARHDREVERIIRRRSKKRLPEAQGLDEERIFAEKDLETKEFYDRVLMLRNAWKRLQYNCSRVKSALDGHEREWADIRANRGL
jgi:hypothetical protein